MITDFTDQELSRALDAGRREAKTEFRARSVRYDPDRDVVEIVTAQDIGFLVPRAWIGPLAQLPPDQLALLDIWPDGSDIEIDTLDIHVSVHGLLSQVLPAMLPTSFLAGLFGGRGGRSTSDAKKATARENGRKGGRPRKPAKSHVA